MAVGGGNPGTGAWRTVIGGNIKVAVAEAVIQAVVRRMAAIITVAVGGGGNPGTGDGGHNGGSHNGNNDQKNNHSGGSKDSSCIPVTLSGLPGQTKPLAICLVTGKDTNVATEIGFATFTLVQLMGRNSD